MEVKNQHIIALTYNLYVKDSKNKEKLQESATVSKPLIYCHGEGILLKKFEEQLEGKQLNDTFDFVLSAADAYGEYNKEHVLELDKKLFCDTDGNIDTQKVYEGSVVQMQTVDGDIVNAVIVHVGADTVTIDLNHPLAGKNLHFVGQIIDIRPASAEELEKIRNPQKCDHCHNCNGNEDHCGESNQTCCHNCNG